MEALRQGLHPADPHLGRLLGWPQDTAHNGAGCVHVPSPLHGGPHRGFEILTVMCCDPKAEWDRVEGCDLIPGSEFANRSLKFM